MIMDVVDMFSSLIESIFFSWYIYGVSQVESHNITLHLKLLKSSYDSILYTSPCLSFFSIITILKTNVHLFRLPQQSGDIYLFRLFS